jgi:ribosome-associated protein
LKLTGLVDSGGEARPQLGAGRVSVNGAVEARRGRRLHDGDIVELNGAAVRVVISDPARQG